MNGRYLFRAHPNYNTNESVICKNAYDNHDISYHIFKGTTVPTKYISTTKNLPIAISYSIGQDIMHTKPVDILLIDTSQLPKDTIMYDCLDEKIIKELKNSGYPSAQNFAASSEEVLFEEKIDGAAIKRIPNIYLYILNALEIQKCSFYPMEDENYQVLIDILLNMINTNDTRLLEFIRNDKNNPYYIELSNLEQHLLSCMTKSSDKAMSMHDIAEELFEKSDNSDMAIQCLKVHTIKKLTDSKGFRNMLFDVLNENPDLFLDDKEFINPVKLMDLLKGNKPITPDYCEKYSGQISRVTTPQYRKAYKKKYDLKELSSQQKQKFVLGGTFSYEEPKGYYAYDANIDENGNLTCCLTNCTMVNDKLQLKKDYFNKNYEIIKDNHSTIKKDFIPKPIYQI